LPGLSEDCPAFSTLDVGRPGKIPDEDEGEKGKKIGKPQLAFASSLFSL
jgi:hypothetical protein